MCERKISMDRRHVLMNDCHSQAVRGSRAMLASEKRRNSPPRGDRTSPTLDPLPGNSVPLSRVSTKNWLSNDPGVESKGLPYQAVENQRQSPDADKRRAHGDGCVNAVLGSNGVGCEQVDDLVGREAGIAHASEDGVIGVGGLGYEQVRRRLRVVGAASKELKARATSTVRDTDGTGELNAKVTGRPVRTQVKESDIDVELTSRRRRHRV